MNFKIDLDKYPKYLIISYFIYIIIRIVEYSTGQVGTPEWIVDFMPIVLPWIFILFDSLSLNKANRSSK